MPETNVALQVSYMSIKNKQKRIQERDKAEMGSSTEGGSPGLGRSRAPPGAWGPCLAHLCLSLVVV